MINWNGYSNFSDGYLSKHYDIVLIDVFHKIKSLILFPPDLLRLNHPSSEELRKHIVLSLNLKTLNEALSQGKEAEELEAIDHIMRIPEAAYFKENWQTAYPIWLINQEMQKRRSNNHFTIIYQLIWTLIRLGKTYQISSFNEPRASIKEALNVILGEIPLKSRLSTIESSIGGEKAYRKQFNTYKAVCHFIAAFEHIKQRERVHNSLPFSLNIPSQIETFLQTSCWFRNALLALKTPNIKRNSLFSGDILIPLPHWIDISKTSISVEPIQEVAKGIEALISKAIEGGV